MFIIVNTPDNIPQEQDTTLPNVIILSPIQDSTVKKIQEDNLQRITYQQQSKKKIGLDGFL